MVSTHIANSEASKDPSKTPYIVIVEDDRDLARMLCEVFRYAGNRCFAIRSKASAEHFLRQVRPDLVIVDYQLKGGVGLDAAQIASEKNVPVIVTSGHREIFDRVKKAGFFYLKKPFLPSELLAVASMLLGTDLSLPDRPVLQIH